MELFVVKVSPFKVNQRNKHSATLKKIHYQLQQAARSLRLTPQTKIKLL
jgi:hypothetical protein